MSQQVDASRISELKEVVAAALAEARAAGASQAEADASLQRGLTADGAPRRGRHDRVSPRSRPGGHRLHRPGEGLGQHRGPAFRGGARDGAQGLRDRAPYRRR